MIYRFIVGGFSVTNITLLRVFAAHISVAFLILGFSVVHLFYLHLKGSKDPLFRGGGYCDAVLFHGFYTRKDGLCLVFLVFSCVLFLLVSPDLVLDVERYVEANPMVTPVAIKPEWYFLAYYAMLRSIESKVGGLVLVLVFLVLLWLPSVKVSCAYRGFRQLVF